MRETNAALRASVLPVLDAGRVPVLGGFVGATRRRAHDDARARRLGLLGRARRRRHRRQRDSDLDRRRRHAHRRPAHRPRAAPRAALSFAEAAELAYFGAKVLHPSTILPAIERDIPVRILNSRKPDGAGTRHHRQPVRPTARRSPRLPAKRDVTVIDITSSRMLMAYGFLRQVFEVFERFRTAVDVVTTSEVSVSVTVDDRRHLDAIVEALSGDRRGVGRARDGAALRRRRPAAQRAGDRRPSGGVLEEVPLRMISQAAVAAEHHGHPAPGRPAARDAAAAPGVVRMKLLLVGYGKMGKACRAARRRAGRRVAGRVDLDGRATGRAADVAIDFSTADALAGNFARYVERGLPVVIGTTGWAAHAPALRAEADAAGLGVVASANFSLGVNLFELIVAEAARLMRAAQQYGAWIHEQHHAAKRDAPSGTALLLRDAMTGGGFTRDRHVVHAGRHDSRHAYDRFRRSLGYDRADAHGARPPRLRQRRLVAAKWTEGRAGLVHDGRDVLGSDLSLVARRKRAGSTVQRPPLAGC